MNIALKHLKIAGYYSFDTNKSPKPEAWRVRRLTAQSKEFPRGSTKVNRLRARVMPM